MNGEREMSDTHAPYILIVDDDAALLQALPQALRLRIKGIQIDTSDSAPKAFSLIEQNDYDAIVSDIKMPGMDGLALLTQIKALRPETPTLLITGHGEHNLAIQALRGGAYDFIQKPIDRDYFVAALLRAVQTHNLRRQVLAQQQMLEQHARSLEQTVQERTRELIEANAAKDEFLSIASHELKTPLASLKGMVQLLRRRLERAGSDEAPSLASIERSIRRMELLVNDLLNTSLITTGMFVLHPSRCDLVILCQRLIEEFVAGTLPTPTVKLEKPDKPVEVEIDVERISQVILNLLANAQKYSPEGAPITLKLVRNEETCTISVSDRGVGIPPEVLSHLFERFYRVPGIEPQTGSRVGLGLGLYISHRIVESHGGTISVQSSPGSGSTFTITLPLSLAAVERQNPETVARRS
jgi:signal transduction histidine kinase